jgi:hypothetical protein
MLQASMQNHHPRSHNTNSINNGMMTPNRLQHDQVSSPNTVDASKPKHLPISDRMMSMMPTMPSNVTAAASRTPGSGMATAIGPNHQSNDDGASNPMLLDPNDINYFDLEDTNFAHSLLSASDLDYTIHSTNDNSDICNSNSGSTSNNNSMNDSYRSPCTCGSGASRINDPSISTLDGNASLEDRFDFVADAVQNAGFKSIDDMIQSYYTTAFDDGSHMLHQQRLSRRRGLPVVLSALRESSRNWSEYEREAYQAEILNHAETLLGNECQQFFAGPAFKERLDQLRSAHSTPQPHRSSPSSVPSALPSPCPSAFSCSPSQPTHHHHQHHHRQHRYQRSRGGSNSDLGTCVPSPVGVSHSRPRTWLSEELPNVWKLVSALSGCSASSQPVAMTLLILCFSNHLAQDEMKQLLQSTVMS